MADYIRRDIVLKIINTVNDTGGFAGYADYCTLFDEIDTMPASNIQSVKYAKWISCKEKMPEDNTSVLFVYVSENGIKSVHYGYHQTIKGLGSSWAKPSGGLQYCDDEVTHWQPIPEPPKDGEQNG